jgi:hypothetical protein
MMECGEDWTGLFEETLDKNNNENNSDDEELVWINYVVY